MHPWRLMSVVAGLLLAAQAQAGWEYKAVTKAEGGKHSALQASTVQAWVDGPKVKIAFTESGNPMVNAGSHLLSQDAGRQVYLVNPQQKTYSLWDMNSLMGMAGGVMQMMQMKVKDSKVEKLLEEPGPALLGHPTTHYRYRTAFTMEMNLMGMKISNRTVKEEDLWSTSDVQDAGLGLWLNQQDIKTGNEQLDAMIATEKSKAKGFPLKTLVTTQTTDQRNDQQTSRLIMEVTELRPFQPAAGFFELPAGYQQTDMTPFGGAGQGKQGTAPAGDGKGDNPLLKLLQNLPRN